MPGCASDLRKRENYFQRRKVGSIRDNPKLMKIRQQFENASKEKSSKDLPETNILSELFNINSTLCHQPIDGSDGFQIRRHSEGEICDSSCVDRDSNSIKSQKSKFHSSRSVDEKSTDNIKSVGSGKSELQLMQSGNEKIFEDIDCLKSLNSKFQILQSVNEKSLADILPVKDQNLKCYLSSSVVENSQPDDYFSKETYCESTSLLSLNDKEFGHSMVASKVENEMVSPPPLPKRGVSPATQSFLSSTKSNPKTYHFKLKELSCSDIKETNNVQKTIELYEGMSSSKKYKLAKNNGNYHKAIRRDESFSRRSHKLRSSFRKSKLLRECPPAPKQKDETLLSDDEGNQNIYQTLSTLPNSLDDPYDRLNRIHDVLHQIHKGQTSACAACKAIPSIQLRDSAILEVKCHEMSPHHHPPCICFSCQHSVFSCSTPSAVQTSQEDDLYYNLCCLNPPNRDSWRQSRRRPVCEQNGRLCVVNCDIEKTNCAKIDILEKDYENLSDCHSVSPRQRDSAKQVSDCHSVSPRQRDSAKQVSGDSCESDEGWVDVTDSEDERPVRNLSSTVLDFHSDKDQNSSLETEEIVSKCSNLKLSNSLSTEHLYESISEIESRETEESSAASSKNAPENDLDSGEWSTESGSPVFNESFDKNSHQKAFTSQHRYTVGGERQEASKKTFMKSVLGRRTHSKKRRMSNFFVPWLASTSDYCVTTESSNHKLCSKKSIKQPSMNGKRNLASKEAFCSSTSVKTSQGLPENHMSSPETTPSLSSRCSMDSSTYLSADQLEGLTAPSRKTSLPCADRFVDVSIERVCRRSSSGNSEHSYILFSPIKEDHVPLYQFYERNVKERVSFCRSSSKNLSPVMWIPEGSEGAKSPQLSVVEQLSPEAADMKMLWCELPEVKESGILERISAQELKLQEAIFEFIQSQASYVRSLKVLYENFIQAAEFSGAGSSVLSKHEQDVLFSDIIQLKEVSERILYDVTARWGDSILIPDICDIILHHAQLPSFSIYVKYCSNRVYQERTLKELKESRLCFLEALRKLESHPICQGLSLESFLFLPMQHIARLPLLLDNVFRWQTPDSPSYAVCKEALEAVHKIFIDCNESARKMERLEEMFVLNKQLEFKECKVIPLISASRWLLKKGELIRLEFDKKTFGRSNRCARISVFIFLFNDLLVVTKKKNEDSYTVVDYCLREKVQATAINAMDLQQPLISPNICRYLIYLKLLNNHQNHPADMILNCTLLSERTRWIEAINSAGQNKPCEIWEYDCPQVQCFKNYIAQQPDELSLQESDVVTVHRKMNDGWYEGRRLRDGLQGWFPASHTMDIPCSRARASNLRQCYRLLMLSHHK